MRRLGVVLMSGVVVLLAGGLADSAEGEPPPLEFTKMAKLSGSEQIAQGGVFLDKMKEALTRVNTLAEEARKDKDVIRLNCVNEKLIGIRGMLSIAEASYTSLKEAVSRDDADERTHEFTKMQIAFTKASELKAEAESCAGEVTVYFGDTVLDYTVDPDVPPEDPTVITPPDLGGIIDRPTETSPAT